MQIELNKKQLDLIDTALTLMMAKMIFAAVESDIREVEKIRVYIRKYIKKT